MIDKICPVCKNRTLQETLSEFEFNNAYKKSKDEALNYLTSLWDFKIDICPICGYATTDFNNYNEKEKEIVLSADFNELKNSNLSLMEGTISTSFKPSLYCGYIAKQSENYFLASTCYYKASSDIISDLIDWQNEMIDYDTGLLNSEGEKLSEYCEKFANTLQHKSLELINKAIEQNPINVDYRLFRAQLYYALDEIDLQNKEVEYIQKNLTPSPIQLKTIKLISKP